MSESKFQTDIIKYLEASGWYSIKLIKTNKNGIPDIVAVREDRTLFIEVKSVKGVISPLQKHRLKELNDIGVPAIVLREGEEFKSKINSK
jgi:Holliday junction resolvase